MANWISININSNQIERTTDRAVLINMPHNSSYDGFKFWHPAKLVSDGRHSSAVELRFNDEWEFKLIKNGKGKYNKFEVIGECLIDAQEMLEQFGCTDANISAPKKKENDENIIEVKEPTYRKPEEVEVLECLTTN